MKIKRVVEKRTFFNFCFINFFEIFIFRVPKSKFQPPLQLFSSIDYNLKIPQQVPWETCAKALWQSQGPRGKGQK